MATPSTAILNSSTFEPLISKLATVLELSQRPEGVTSTQSKQAVLAATHDFRESITRAKELALSLPGGELTQTEQEEIIAMLEQLRDQRRRQIEDFVAREASAAAIVPGINRTRMIEIDSAASTPAQ